MFEMIGTWVSAGCAHPGAGEGRDRARAKGQKRAMDSPLKGANRRSRSVRLCSPRTASRTRLITRIPARARPRRAERKGWT